MTTPAQIEVLCDDYCSRVAFCTSHHMILEAKSTHAAMLAVDRLTELDIASKVVPVLEDGVAYVNVWF